mmetsp:Transcript_89134/g.226705  ORF Transcript_89134/g.226705 Transcript_89134/m.226705 type:complete len:246 (+) Transcript_89134:402-1139(+)
MLPHAPPWLAKYKCFAPPAMAVHMRPCSCGTRHLPTTFLFCTSIACTLRWPSRRARTRPPGMAVIKLVANPSTCSSSAALPSTFQSAPAGTSSLLCRMCLLSCTMRPWLVPTTTHESFSSKLSEVGQSVSTTTEMTSSRLLPSPKSRNHLPDTLQTLFLWSASASASPSEASALASAAGAAPSASPGESRQAATRWPRAWRTMTSQLGSATGESLPGDWQSTATSRFAWPSKAEQYGAGRKLASR